MDSRTQELMHIEEEIRKTEERRQKLLERRNRKKKEIEKKREREKHAWYHSLNVYLHEGIRKVYGDNYWEKTAPEEIASVLLESCGISDQEEDGREESDQDMPL